MKFGMRLEDISMVSCAFMMYNFDPHPVGQIHFWYFSTFYSHKKYNDCIVTLKHRFI